MLDKQLDLAVSYGVPEQTAPVEALLRRWVASALVAADRRGGIGIRIVDHAEAKALNAQYRQKDYPTNVLSFPAEVPEAIPVELLGDLILCAPVIAAQAVDQGKLASNHWAHMVVHGVLHLCGFDHIEPHQAEVMEALERQALGKLGIPDPYA